MNDHAESMLLGIAKDGESGRFGRLALVVEHSSMSMAAARLRELVPTFCVGSLGEIADALAAHERGDCKHENAAAEPGPGMLVGLDISGLPLDDTRLFAANLLHSRATGTVYVMTPGQFALFDAGTFDFVVR